MRNLTVALVIVIGVLGGFYSGWKYSQSKVSAGTGATVAATALPGPAATSATGTGTGTGGQGGFGGRGTAGQVTAVNGNVVIGQVAFGGPGRATPTPGT